LSIFCQVGFEVVELIDPHRDLRDTGVDYVDVREDRAVFSNRADERARDRLSIKSCNRGDSSSPVFAQSMYDRNVKAAASAEITVTNDALTRVIRTSEGSPKSSSAHTIRSVIKARGEISRCRIPRM